MLMVRLPRSFDPDRLKSDLENVGRLNLELRPQPGSYHGGEWVGLSLRAIGGRATDPSAGKAGLEDYEDTPVLSSAPYFAEVLRSLELPMCGVRLLYLPPSGHIRHHNDAGLGFASGWIRLHIPIVTHDDVVFTVGGERCRWMPGELWYADFEYPHSVLNQSPITRVHMVIDSRVDERALALFPQDFVRRKEQTEGIARTAPPIVLPAEELDRLACTFEAPAGTFPGIDRSFRGLIRRDGKRLIVFFGRRPTYALQPCSAREFAVVGSAPHFRFHFEVSEQGVTGVEIRIAGFPVDRTNDPTPDGTPRPKHTHTARLTILRSRL